VGYERGGPKEQKDRCGNDLPHGGRARTNRKHASLHGGEWVLKKNWHGIPNKKRGGWFHILCPSCGEHQIEIGKKDEELNWGGGTEKKKENNRLSEWRTVRLTEPL